MSKTMYLNYSSSLDKITEINSSFDSGILRVAYHGLNRNNSFIAKDSFERNIKSMFNCPVVTNYKRDETDANGNEGDFGSHDGHVEIDRDDNGNIVSIDYINDTQPIGVVYESAEWWWEDVEDESGVHEYLCTNVILWKRQDAYNKLKQGKVFNHSMEINIVDGSFSDKGYYEIRDFEFTAFCILGSTVEPCFEGSQIQLFNKNEFKEQFTEMMKELKESMFSLTNHSSNEVDNTNIKQEGGTNIVDEKLEILKKFNLTVEQLKFNIEEVSLEELEGKIQEQFSLSHNNLMSEINKILDTMTEIRENYWGELKEKRMFYLLDIKDNNAIVVNYNWDSYYGIPYTVDGDIVTLNVDAKIEYVSDWRPKQVGDNSLFTSMKEIIDSEIANVKENYETKVAEVTEKFTNLETEKSELEIQFADINEKYSAIEPELTKLKEFEATKLAEERTEIETELFSQYEESLKDAEEFETLKTNSKDFSIEELEAKLAVMYVKTTANFSAKKQNSTIKIKVEHIENNEEPYGGLHKRYLKNN